MSGAGKTAVVNWLAGGPKAGVSGGGAHAVTIASDRHVLCFVDVAGDGASRSLWSAYYPSADAVVFVVDCASRAVLEDAGVALNLALSNPALRGKPLVVCAHKQDVLTALGAQQLSDALNLHVIRGRAWTLLTTSVVTGEGMTRIVEWLVAARSNR